MKNKKITTQNPQCSDWCKKYSIGYKALKFPSILILNFEFLEQKPALSPLARLGTHLFAVLRACEHPTLHD